MTAALALVAALLLVPGVGAALAVAAPGAISIESRIALAFGFGYALVAGVATLLALAHVFHRPTFIAGVVLATAAVWVLALRRASPRAHASALRAQARETPFTLVAGVALLLAVAVSRLLYSPDINLAIRSAWRYWADGLEVAAAGHVPAQTGQWGTEIPTTVSKVVLNSFEGGVSFLLGADPLPPMYGILAVTAVGLVAALLALGRELGLGVFAPLVPALAVLVPDNLPLAHELSNDLRFYTAENMGRMVAFCALLTGIHAVRARESRAPALATGVLLAVAGLTHLVPALVAAAMLAFYALAAIVLKQSGVRRAPATGAVVAGVFAFCYVGVLVLSGGDLGFQRATSGAAFEGLPPDVDPTRSFTRQEFVGRVPKEGHFLIPPRTIVGRYAETTVGRPDGAVIGLVALGVLGLASVGMVLAARRFVPLAAVAWGVAATAVAAAFFFSYRYDTRVPGDFGVRRLYHYAVLVPALLVPAVLETMASLRSRLGRTAVAVLALAAGVLAVAAALDRIPRDRALTRAAAGRVAIERVADVVPCGARMLANARTAGTWEAMTGRRAVTEGHAPFLRPKVMAEILPVLIGASEFFRDPQANRAFLVRERVQYLVVVKPGSWIGSGGPRVSAQGDAEAVASLPGVHLLYGDRRVSILVVGSTDAADGGGQPRRCPL
jgi:hypothetical protein